MKMKKKTTKLEFELLVFEMGIIGRWLSFNEPSIIIFVFSIKLSRSHQDDSEQS